MNSQCVVASTVVGASPDHGSVMACSPTIAGGKSDATLTLLGRDSFDFVAAVSSLAAGSSSRRPLGRIRLMRSRASWAALASAASRDSSSSRIRSLVRSRRSSLVCCSLRYTWIAVGFQSASRKG